MNDPAIQYVQNEQRYDGAYESYSHAFYYERFPDERILRSNKLHDGYLLLPDGDADRDCIADEENGYRHEHYDNAH